MEHYNQKLSINDFWIPVVDRLPTEETNYLCTIRTEIYDRERKEFSHIHHHTRWTYFKNGKFLLPDITGGENKQYNQYVTDWLENPEPVSRGRTCSYFEEYGFATEKNPKLI
jgi:hypothetical protein